MNGNYQFDGKAVFMNCVILYFVSFCCLFSLTSCSNNTLNVDARAGENLTIKGARANVNIKNAKAGRNLRVCSDGNLSSPRLEAPKDVEISTTCEDF